MNQDLTGQVAIVTGGSDGIGLATAALLARHLRSAARAAGPGPCAD
jgi:NAD(P)-dependent dehydrogenase (short-subunit alcohol dehydrogenase family)